MKSTTPNNKYPITSGTIKVCAAFEELIVMDEFNAIITRLRGEYRIPPSGFVDDEKELEKWWRQQDGGRIQKLFVDLSHLRQEYGFYSDNDADPFTEYLLFNKEIFYGMHEHAWDVCDACDRNPKELTRAVTKFSMMAATEKISEHEQAFPIAIYISPYATERDIISYVKKTHKELIEPRQKKYRKSSSPIGKYRLKNQTKKARNIIIHEHRDLPAKQIIKLIRDHGIEPPDEGGIGAIKSQESKRRKKRTH